MKGFLNHNYCVVKTNSGFHGFQGPPGVRGPGGQEVGGWWLVLSFRRLNMGNSTETQARHGEHRKTGITISE